MSDNGSPQRGLSPAGPLVGTWRLTGEAVGTVPYSRLAYTEILADETRDTAVAFWHHAHAWFTTCGRIEGEPAGGQPASNLRMPTSTASRPNSSPPILQIESRN